MMNRTADGFMIRLAALVCVLSWGFLSGSGFADERLNIAYIIADDQSWPDYGFMGNERVHTPNLDKLAGQSARFVNGYVPSSVCRPSLVTMLTGLYPHQHQVHFNHGPPGNRGYNQIVSREEYVRTRNREFDLIKRLVTLPGELRQAGYRCFQTGKFWEGHWRNGGFTEGMTTFTAPPAEQTFGGVRKLASGLRVAHGNGDVGLQIGRQTMQPIFDFISDCDSKQQPWMVWYAPYLPHQPHDSPERFRKLANQKQDVEPHELPYFASIAQFDETVGKLVDFVDSKKRKRNTLFVFVSDNGWRPSMRTQRNRPSEFEHTRRSKRAPFDDGLRTPILLRCTDVIQPKTHIGLVSSIDLMPTCLAAAGLKHGADLPGKNLLPIARGDSELDPGRAIFGGIYPGDATSLGKPETHIAYRWIRKGQYKLIVPSQKKPAWGQYLDAIALFDLENDPFEKSNLAEQPKYKRNVRVLKQLLDDWWNPSVSGS